MDVFISNDIFFEITNFLSLVDLCYLSIVCKKFFSYFKNEQVWKNRLFEINKLDYVDYKDALDPHNKKSYFNTYVLYHSVSMIQKIYNSNMNHRFIYITDLYFLQSINLSFTKINCDHHFWRNINMLNNLLEIDLSYCDIVSLDGLKFSNDNKNIKKIILSNNQINDISLLLIFKNLAVLHLSNNQISYIPDTLCMLKKLRLLYLSNNRICTDASFWNNIRKIESLDYLFLHDNNYLPPDKDVRCYIYH